MGFIRDGYAKNIFSFTRLNSEAVKFGEERGISFICSMCKWWTLGYEQGVYNVNSSSLTCLREDCFGPTDGGVYQYYEGPLGENMKYWCCFCGKPSIYILANPNFPGKVFGVCKEHFKEFRKAGEKAGDIFFKEPTF